MRAITPIRRAVVVMVRDIITLPVERTVPSVVTTEPAGTTVPPAVAPPATTIGLSVMLEVPPPGRGFEMGGIGCGTDVPELELGTVITVPPLNGVVTIELDITGVLLRTRNRPNSPRRVVVGMA
jgi:hypothetical protein